jgi:hypothetical protein
VADVFALWAKLAGRNVVIDPAVQGVVSVRAVGFVEGDWLDALSAAASAEVQLHERDILQVVPQVKLAERATIAAEGIEVAEVAKTLGITDKQCTVTAGGRRVSVFAWNANAHDLLHAVAIASGHTWARRGDRYVIE